MRSESGKPCSGILLAVKSFHCLVCAAALATTFSACRQTIPDRSALTPAPAESVPTSGIPSSKRADVSHNPSRLDGDAAGKVFDQTLELQGIRFRVTATNTGSVNTLTITPSGLMIDNSPLVRTVEGTVMRAQVADLNRDDSPEIYVMIVSAGSGSYGSLVAFSANRRKSLSEISLPDLADDPVLARGYGGHDEFAIADGMLIRRFPVYRERDTQASPTGGVREIHYKLGNGESGWLLRVDRFKDV